MQKLSQADIPFGELDRSRFDGQTVGEIIYQAFPYIFSIAGFAILFFIVAGGFQIMLSKGDPKAVESGKAKITYAVVGLIVMFAAYWIIQIIGATLGIHQITGGVGGPGIFP